MRDKTMAQLHYLPVIVLLVVITVIAVIAGSCGGDDSPEVGGRGNTTAHTVVDVNVHGELVPCVFADGGGVSCDWGTNGP